MVREFLLNIDDYLRQQDCFTLLPLMEEWSGYKAHQAGTMVGFGHYHYAYESGREGDFFITGFAPRKHNLAIYIMPGLDKYKAQLLKLGRHKKDKSCIYVNRLKDIDLGVLKGIVMDSVTQMQEKYTCTELLEKQ